jgi:hypothetical protein
MSLVLPPAVNYPNPLISVQSRWANAPVEGNRMIQCEVDWGSMGGSGAIKNVAVQLSNNAEINFRQICALAVDNSQCGADVEFQFPDTGETLTIPAYSPKVICPVFTNATSFNVACGFDSELVESGDFTTFSIHNSVPPPIAVPTSQEQDTSAVAAIAGAASTTAIIAAGINGTLNVVYVNYASPFGGLPAAGEMTWKLVDGSAKVLWTGQMGGGISSAWNVILANLSNVAFRFTNGVNLVQTVAGGAAIGGAFNVVLGYRQP